MSADRPLALIGALTWRTRKEGARQLLAPLLSYTAMLTAIVLVSLTGSGHINGGQTLVAFAERYGAHTNAVTIGVGLLVGPGFVSIYSSYSIIMLVRNLIGSEASRGGVEALLAAPYRPGTIMIALLGYVGCIATFYWAAATAILAVLFGLIIVTTGASVAFTVSYLLAALIVPLLAVWAATALSLLVYLLFPRMAKQGSYGLNLGGGSMGSLPAILPALGTMFAFIFWAPHTGAGELLAVAGGAVAVVGAAGVILVTRLFRPDAVLEA
jgi:hypothetical protein